MRIMTAIKLLRVFVGMVGLYVLFLFYLKTVAVKVCHLLNYVVLGYRLAFRLKFTSFISNMQIDMDTIEVSNLNRQFLFRKSHVGQSKAKVSSHCC